MNVNIAFVNGNLHEQMYMVQLEGYKSTTNLNQVRKLQKSIYGLN